MAINLTQAQLSAALDVAANKYAGQKVPYQGQYVGECLSLCKQIYTDITNLQMPGAVNNYYWSDSYWLYFDQSPPLPSLFIKTTYVTNTKYPKGSLVFYAATHHIGIWWADNGNGTHTVFEQNADPDGSPAHFGTRANSKVTGILVPHTVDVGGKGAGVPIQQGDEMITDADNNYNRWRQLGWFIRGRELSRDEFRNAAVGQTWLRAMEILADNPEADATQNAQSVGQVAVRDKWDQQIYGLQSQLKAVQDDLLKLQQTPAITQIVNKCDVNLDALPADKASWLVQFVAWLTGTKKP